MDEEIERRLIKTIEETFTRLKTDANIYKLKEKYKKKKNKTKNVNNEIFAKGYTSPYPDRKDPQKIKHVIENLIKIKEWEDNLADSKIINNWEKIVGKNIAEHNKIVKIENNILYVKSSSTTWSITIRQNKTKIQRNINEIVGKNRIKNIVILSPQSPSWNKGKRHIKGRGPRDTYG